MKWEDIDSFFSKPGVDIQIAKKGSIPADARSGYIEGHADGAIPNGSVIEKVNTEPGDFTNDGALGKVISSIVPPKPLLHPASGLPIKFIYWIQWDEQPNVVIAISDYKIKERQ